MSGKNEEIVTKVLCLKRNWCCSFASSWRLSSLWQRFTEAVKNVVNCDKTKFSDNSESQNFAFLPVSLSAPLFLLRITLKTLRQVEYFLQFLGINLRKLKESEKGSGEC